MQGGAELTRAVRRGVVARRADALEHLLALGGIGRMGDRRQCEQSYRGDSQPDALAHHSCSLRTICNCARYKEYRAAVNLGLCEPQGVGMGVAMRDHRADETVEKRPAELRLFVPQIADLVRIGFAVVELAP